MHQVQRRDPPLRWAASNWTTRKVDCDIIPVTRLSLEHQTMPFSGRHQLRLQFARCLRPEKDNVLLLSPGRAVSTTPACQPVGRTPWVYLPFTEDLPGSVSCTPAIDPGDAKVWPAPSSQDLLPIPTSTGSSTPFKPASPPCRCLCFIVLWDSGVAPAVT